MFQPRFLSRGPIEHEVVVRPFISTFFLVRLQGTVVLAVKETLVEYRTRHALALALQGGGEMQQGQGDFVAGSGKGPPRPGKEAGLFL